MVGNRRLKAAQLTQLANVTEFQTDASANRPAPGGRKKPCDYS